MAIYEDTKPINSPTTNIILKEIPIYGSSRLGQYRPKTATKKTALGQRIYEFSNHLGNVLVTLSDNKVPQTDGTYESVVLSASDYYPFGMAMGERTFSNESYRYGFNGKENDTDFGNSLQDFDARFYSGILGRWLSVDFFASLYPNLTPYRSMFNNPINFIDNDGNIELPLRGTYVIQKNTSTYIKDQKVYNRRTGWIYQTGYFESSTQTDEYKAYVKKVDANAIIRTSEYNILRRSTEKRVMTSPHVGSDFRASVGTSVYNLGLGKVHRIDRGSGNLTIEYENGDKVTFRHLSSINENLSEGETVFEGEVIAETGMNRTTSPHLHIDAVDEDGDRVNFEERTYGKLTNSEFFNDYDGDHKQTEEYRKFADFIYWMAFGSEKKQQIPNIPTKEEISEIFSPYSH